jgi:hypothetical protein
MKLKAMTLTAALLAGTSVYAQSGLDGVVAALRDQGYTKVEVEREGDRIKVEATRGGVQRELYYDARTGALLYDDAGDDDDDGVMDDDEDDRDDDNGSDDDDDSGSDDDDASGSDDDDDSGSDDDDDSGDDD